MADVVELIDRGIKAYVAGRVGEALRSFQEVLELDPGNPRARSYLVLVHGGGPGSPSADVPPPAALGASAPLPELDIPLDDLASSPWDQGPAAAATFVLEPEGGLDLAAVADKSDIRPLVPAQPAAGRTTAPAHDDVAVWMQAARELFALGDFSGSLELIEKILKVDPDHREAREYLRQNEATLISMYESKLGPRTGVPRLAIKPEEVMWLNLDHRAGFLLAQIDGTVDYEGLFALSGLPRLDTARILARLIADGVITS
jgi:tetratricopeptide (TPR) repeat protein